MEDDASCTSELDEKSLTSIESLDSEDSSLALDTKPLKITDLRWRKVVLLITALVLVVHHHQRSPTNMHSIQELRASMRPETKQENRCKSFSTKSVFPLATSAPGRWPEEICTIHINSTIDYSMQPTLHYAPIESVHPLTEHVERPLLVALHTWSMTYTQDNGGETVYAKWAIDHGWHFLHPHFRGRNMHPSACGSDLAVQDVVDAVNAIIKEYSVDSDRIYLVGVSGGGHMATLLAGRHPEIWAGVSAWAPISDMRVWWEQRQSFAFSFHQLKHRHYAKYIEKCVGGKPDGSDLRALEESFQRSPNSYLSSLQPGQVTLDIFAGITDGREGGSVPFSHALYAYDAACLLSGNTLGKQLIESFYSTQKAPQLAGSNTVADPLLNGRDIYFRKNCSNVRITIFEGGHEILHQAALNWLKEQRKGSDGKFDLMEGSNIDWIDTSSVDSQAGG